MVGSCGFACAVHHFLIVSFYDCLSVVATYQFW
jgi:hypothetical protein